jgi:ribosomal protein S18 acetylase RimI-like enzyme
MSVEIRELTDDDVGVYWPLRLRALREESQAFGSSYDEAKDRPLSQVAEQFRDTAQGGGCTLGAFTDGQLVGMVTLVRNSGAKICHVGNIFGMYVAPEARGQHAGRLLLEAAIARARAADGLEQLHLAVVTSQAPAHALYHALGFRVYGRLPHALKLPDGRYCDEDLMLLMLREGQAHE